MGDVCAVVWREAGLVLALLVPLLLELVRLVLKTVVLCHLLSDGGSPRLERVEPDLVRHNEQDLVSSLLEVLDRLIKVRSLILEIRDVGLDELDLVLHIGDSPCARSKRVQLGRLLAVLDLVNETRDLVLAFLDLLDDPLLLGLDGTDLCGKLRKLAAQVVHLEFVGNDGVHLLLERVGCYPSYS